MTLPASLQSIRSLPQLLTLVGSVDANHDGYLQASEARALFLPEEQPRFSEWYSEVNATPDMYHNRLDLSEIAGAMSRSGSHLNKLFSADVVQYFKRIQDFKITSQAFTPLRAEWVNGWVDELQDRAALKAMLIATARILNGMAGEGRDGAEYCRNYIAELSPKALFLLLSIAGSDLWPGLFTQAAKRLESHPNMKEVIQAADPTGELLPTFFSQMVAYGRGRHYLSRIKDLIYIAVTQAVRSADVYFIPTFLPTLKALAASSRETADELGQTLLRFYTESSDRRLKMGFQFVLWSLRSYWHAPDVKKVAFDSTKLETPPVPDSWLADGVLWAAVIFDFDQKVHRDRMVQMLRQNGFSKTNVVGDPRVQEKMVLEKTVNGVALRLDVMYAPNERDDFENDFHFSQVMRSRADIVSVRAHHSSALYYLQQCSGCEMQEKLVFNGGCTGVENVPGLMRTYRGNFFIADKDVGKGHDNSLVLYHVMRAIAGGAEVWEQVHRQVRLHVPVDRWGLLLPDADLLKFYYTLDKRVYLPYVQDPLANDSSWGSRKAVTTPRSPKGKGRIQK